MSFTLLVHLSGIADHSAAFPRILEAWERTFEIPLLHFPKSGPGVPPSKELLEGKATFGRLDGETSLRLKQSRKRNAVDLEIWFTNPARAFYGDLNYVAAVFPNLETLDSSTDRARAKVASFMNSTFSLGSVVDASFYSDGVSLNSPALEIVNAVKIAQGFVPAEVFWASEASVLSWGGRSVLTEAGLEVVAETTAGPILSVVGALGIPPVDSAWKLFGSLERLGLLVGEADPKLLNSHGLRLEDAGAFLKAFESRFGRTFADRYSDGYRVQGSA
jgi:hypothetical protein